MMQLNTQPIEKQITREDGALDIVSIFYTIQGEGPEAGRPAVFIRTAGCSLKCEACDSDYTTGRKILTVEEIVAQVQKLRTNGLVVLTGGEPFRQSCGPLILALLAECYDVQVETNGTLFDPTMTDAAEVDGFSIVCSPKTPEINQELAPYITAYKYIVQAGETDPMDGLPLASLGYRCKVARQPQRSEVPIYVQPQDDQDPEKNAANCKEAVRVSMKHGYRLSMQLHKYLGLE